MTPYRKLQPLPNWESYLRPVFTKEILERNYKTKTPLQAGKDKKKARDELMKIVLPKLSGTIPATTTDEKEEKQDFRVF